MDIRKERCIAAFEKLGLPDAASYFGDYSQKGPFMLIEEGAISVDEFHAMIREAIGSEVSDEEIDRAFCQFLIGIPVERLERLRKLRKDYKIYMLSNTNPIMWGSTIRDEFTKEGLQREDYFDGMVTSFEAGSMKPDEKIFRYAIEKLGIQPEETLFFDDSQRNLDAASRLGFATRLVPPGTEFRYISTGAQEEQEQ